MEKRVLTFAEFQDKFDKPGMAAGNTEADVQTIADSPNQFTQGFDPKETDEPSHIVPFSTFEKPEAPAETDINPAIPASTEMPSDDTVGSEVEAPSFTSEEPKEEEEDAPESDDTEEDHEDEEENEEESEEDESNDKDDESKDTKKKKSVEDKEDDEKDEEDEDADISQLEDEDYGNE